MKIIYIEPWVDKDRPGGTVEADFDPATGITTFTDFVLNVPCSLGVGCEDAGMCYAMAHGEPDRCGRP